MEQEILNVIEKYNLKEYCIAWYEKEHLDYIKEVAEKHISEDEEMADLKAQIKQERYEIQEILKSRAFKLGRKLTNKNLRLDLSEFDTLN